MIPGIIFSLLVGLCIGSFLNAAIWRLHEGITILTGRSMCTACKHELSWKDLIPVISYVLLAGQCRYCKGGIAVSYAIVELITALLFTLFYWTHPFIDTHLLLLWVYTAILIFLFVYDLRWMLLPDSITIPASIFALLAQAMITSPQSVCWVTGCLTVPGWGITIGAGLVGAGFFLAQYLISRGTWIGGGDIRLGFLMGVLLGWPGVIIALGISYCLGAFVGILLLALKRSSMKSEVPFGPFMVTATLLLLVFPGIEQYFFLV